MQPRQPREWNRSSSFFAPNGRKDYANRHDSAIHTTERTQRDAASLCDKLEYAILAILPRSHEQRDQFVCVMRQAIALNASRFNTQRMVQEYVVKAYFQ